MPWLGGKSDTCRINLRYVSAKPLSDDEIVAGEFGVGWLERHEATAMLALREEWTKSRNRR